MVGWVLRLGLRSRSPFTASTTCKQQSGSGPFKVSGLTWIKTTHVFLSRRVIGVCRFHVLAFWVAFPDLRRSVMENEGYGGSSPIHVLEASFSRRAAHKIVHQKGSSTKAETSCANSRAVFHWKKFFKLWKEKSTKRLPSRLSSLSVPKLSRKSKSERDNPRLKGLYSFKSSLANFRKSEIQDATDNFSDENLIGRGGYADVFKGLLKDGRHVAIKRLIKGTPDEQTSTFLSELGIIAHLDHPNIAKLVGCCVDGGMFLVFQLSRLGSLGSILHGSRGTLDWLIMKDTLDWSKRYKIALGTADGLAYLHETCEKRIIHRDIKADNILLTEDFQAQICDFGISKWLPKEVDHCNVSKFEGTFGYFAPEYFMHGIVDEKTDVYAFGVLLLELITGRKAVDEQQQSVVLWAKPLLDNNKIRELLDPTLADHYDTEEVDRMVLTISLCIEQSPLLRPRMSQVVILLRGDEYFMECTNGDPRPSHQRTYSEELMDVQEYNSTKYRDRLKEVALG